MTVEECYAALEGDYNEVFSRLRSEERITKFAVKLIEDENFETLCQSLETGELETAFRAAHSLKGISKNFAFTKLCQSSSELTEALRRRNTELAKALLPQLCKDYHQTVAALSQLKASMNPA